MEAQIRGTNQAIRNAADGQALIDTAEGAHAEVEFLLQRMRELAVQAGNDTNTATDRLSLNDEVAQLVAEVDRIAAQTTWGGNKLLDGTFSSKTLQIGAFAAETTNVSIDSIASAQLGAYQANSVSKVLAAGAAASGATDTRTSAAMVISGTQNAASISYAAKSSAKTVAAAVNAATATTGVSAEARTNVILKTLSAAGTVSFTLTGTSSASISAVIASNSDLRNLRDAINSAAGATGITATISGSNAALLLTSATGEDIGIQDFVHSGDAAETLVAEAADFDGAALGTSTTLTGPNGGAPNAADSTIAVGQLKFSSTGAFTIAESGGSSTTGYFNATTASGSINALQNVSVTSVTNAASAIRTIDGALLKIADQRGNLGAVSNRLDSTVRNLTNVVTNIQASQGRIQDADFAAETTNLAKSQILQQAAMAMLAQANASKQGVLSLLQR